MINRELCLAAALALLSTSSACAPVGEATANPQTKPTAVVTHQEAEIEHGWLRAWDQYRELHIDLGEVKSYEYSEITLQASQAVLHLDLGHTVTSLTLPLNVGRAVLGELFVAVRTR